ncbi:hypothetical protein THAOC_31579 [Thalassiosira oceanica]|uniref:Uncharacterized protein n=1 Tax=Thalassiosira oceanica TaxID=159749 RepID=K0RKX9_THAOC|nr:hypothetical protein THAOC_31579 [Thalassiosira oceanica]|eukprot:EJK49541.1 hypothetical protein THAOC_31579 [Thalassiosira oceanica]
MKSAKTASLPGLLLLATAKSSGAWTASISSGRKSFDSSLQFRTIASEPTIDDNRAKDCDSLEDLQAQLQIAIGIAREVDKRHGLCTPESAFAWEAVDRLYESTIEMTTVDVTILRYTI